MSMFFDIGKVIDKLSMNVEEILLVVFILLAGLILGKLVGKVVGIILRKSGIVRILQGSKAEERTKKTSFTIINFIEIVIRWTIYLIAIGQAIEVLGLEQLNRLMTNLVSYLPNVVVALIIMVIGFVIADKIIGALEDFMRESKLPIYPMLSIGIRYLIYTIAIIMALSQVKVSTQVLVVMAGVFSFLAAMFIIVGARDVASNFFAGLQIIWYKSLRVGDLIQAENVEGVIEEIGIINTTIKTGEGEYILIPNSKLANEIVIKKP
ncbi:MAG: mechanosensitive ion channel domain-containing protein [Candidatus Methanofastidiosia archaeon]